MFCCSGNIFGKVIQQLMTQNLKATLSFSSQSEELSSLRFSHQFEQAIQCFERFKPMPKTNVVQLEKYDENE